MSMIGNIAVEAAMDELLEKVSNLAKEQPLNYEWQLNQLVELIRSIKSCAEKGWY